LCGFQLIETVFGLFMVDLNSVMFDLYFECVDSLSLVDLSSFWLIYAVIRGCLAISYVFHIKGKSMSVQCDVMQIKDCCYALNYMHAWFLEKARW